jgi:4-alpha-glucanotransferase
MGNGTANAPAKRRASREEILCRPLRYHEFVQWLFSVQWKELRAYCAAKGIRLIGDIPLCVAHQSADVWAHPELFKLDVDGNPTVVAGVPPDYFSKTGQLWGLPVYRWEALEAQNYRWWIERLRTAFARFDVNRLDHFIGFVRTYEVSAQARTAVKGQYLPGGGASFFKAVGKNLGSLSFIADDLGDTSPEVVALLNQFKIPGTRVLQFEFGSDLQGYSSGLASHPLETVVYTGTHDNDTTAGWYESLPILQQEALRKKLKVSDREIVWAMIRAALASPANTAIVPGARSPGAWDGSKNEFPRNCERKLEVATEGWCAKRASRAKAAKPDDGIWATDEREPRSTCNVSGRIAEGMALHTDYQSTRAQLSALGLEISEPTKL